MGEGRNLAVIPARGGSKRIPRKNIRDFAGHPLIFWPIDTALTSGLFSRVIVSTDDDEVARTARRAGADVPFMRAAHLAGDLTPTLPVIVDAIRRLKAEGEDYDNVCCIYPSAVFMTAGDLSASLMMMKESKDRDFVIAVVKYPHPIQRALRVTTERQAMYIDPNSAQMRTQDLEERWHDAGQFYWGKADAWLSGIPPMQNALAFALSDPAAVDIDTADQWEVAVRLITARLEGPEDHRQRSDM